eukprot:UN28946
MNTIIDHSDDINTNIYVLNQRLTTTTPEPPTSTLAWATLSLWFTTDMLIMDVKMFTFEIVQICKTVLDIDTLTFLDVHSAEQNAYHEFRMETTTVQHFDAYNRSRSVREYFQTEITTRVNKIWYDRQQFEIILIQFYFEDNPQDQAVDSNNEVINAQS